MTSRREMLRGTALGVAALAVPGWLRRAFADASMPSSSEPTQAGDTITVGTAAGRRAPADVGRALERARTRGRPLAVIVVPENEELRRDRELAIGAFLRTGSVEQLAPLGGADVICATPSALRRANVTGADRVDDRTLFVRVETEGSVRAAAAKRLTNGAIAGAAAELFPIDGKSIEERRALGRVAQRLREGPIPGGNWSYTEGCGHHRPSDAARTDDVGVIGCGMGSMGGTAQRFLAFFVEERRPTRRRP